MKKTLMFFVAHIVVSLDMTFARENMDMPDKAPVDSSMAGYTQKFTLPDDGLNEEERKYITVAMKINDVISEEINIATITEKISSFLLGVSSRNSQNNQIFISTESREKKEGGRYVSRIIVRNIDNTSFDFGSLGGGINGYDNSTYPALEGRIKILGILSSLLLYIVVSCVQVQHILLEGLNNLSLVVVA